MFYENHKTLFEEKIKKIADELTSLTYTEGDSSPLLTPNMTVREAIVFLRTHKPN